MANPWARDRATYFYFGAGIIVEQGLEMLAFDSAPWRAVGMWLFENFA